MGLSILAILAMLLFPQVPPEVRADVTAYNRWLADVRNRYGTSLDVLRALGLFDIRRSFGLRLLLVALAFHLLIHIADRIGSAGPRSPWQRVFDLLPHMGVLLVLAGLLVNERWGWREVDLPLNQGQVAPIGHGTDISLAGEEVTASFLANGSLADWRTELALLQSEQEIRRGTVWPTHPLYYDGMLFCQPGLGPSVEVLAEDKHGQPVSLQVLPTQGVDYEGTTLRFRNNGDEEYLLVPSQKLSLRLTYYSALPQRGEAGSTVHVQVYREGQAAPILDAFFRDDAVRTIENVTYHFSRRYHAIFQLAYAPGLPLVLLGFLLVIVGTLTMSYLPRDISGFN